MQPSKRSLYKKKKTTYELKMGIKIFIELLLTIHVNSLITMSA